ncbi:MAG: hypothetical protein RSF77_04225 [Oscillospiraceae bacterium]
MKEYKSMYLSLFNAITDALVELENGNLPNAKKILITSQQATEEQFISFAELASSNCR